MAINYNEINIPINAEKRDPFYGRSKSEVGLGLTPNMSYQGLQTAILANVRSTIDEGVAYNYSDFANEANPILANIIKLKPSSSRATIHFSLGTWTNNSEFIPRETATLELRSNKTNVSYNLFVTEPHPITYSEDSTDESPNRATALTSTKVIIRQFNTGGWLVQLKVIDWKIDALWINVVESKNVDIQNPMQNIYDESEFGRNIEFYCDKSRISTNLEIGRASLIARSLTHDIPLKLDSADPEDFYNSNSSTHSVTSIDLSGLLGTSALVKDDTLIPLSIKTDEESCEVSQLLPISVNRLNHQIKLRLAGSVHSSQVSSWKLAQTDQTNSSSFFDTDPEAINEYPLSITELSHDINLSIGKAEYTGSMPESGNKGGEGYNSYELVDGKINYATIHDITTGRNEFYGYDSENKSWILNSDEFSKIDKAASLNTKSNYHNSLNLVLHGLDHDVKIEAVNSEYRSGRGKATDLNQLWNSTRKSNLGIRNLTWESGDTIEARRNSYVTGHFNLNTFEKDVYQCMDLTVHGLDHNIKLDFFRIDVDKLTSPSNVDLSRTDRFRPNSNGRDLNGSLSIDTFTGRVQKSRLEVIDGRYSDCTRGLALKINGNFMPWDKIDNYGDYGSFLPTAPTTDEIEEIYPTINGVPFTGDFRYEVYYPTSLEKDGISKKHSVRNITIPSYHNGSSLNDAGEHKWEVLSTQRIAGYNNSRSPIAKLVDIRSDDNVIDLVLGYGLTRLTTINTNLTGTETEKYNSILASLGSDEDVMSVYAFKSVMAQSNSSNNETYVTKSQLNLELNQLNSNLSWKESVNTFSDIGTTYPNPEDGWTVNVKDVDITYRYTGNEWIAISANSIPLATQSVSGKMSAEDKRKLDTEVFTASNVSSIDISTIDQDINPSTKIENLLSSLGDDDELISVGVLKAIVKAINYRFEKLEESAGI